MHTYIHLEIVGYALRAHRNLLSSRFSLASGLVLPAISATLARSLLIRGASILALHNNISFLGLLVIIVAMLSIILLDKALSP
jgi:hypothetical protein